jgi:hypothetical protein
MLLAALVGLLSLAGLTAAGGAAAEKGVHFDPNSPAGKEYALPLDQARNEASGGGGPEEAGSGTESGEAAPLFGAGVSGPGATAGSVQGHHGGGASGGGGREGPTPSEAPERAGTHLGPAALDSGDGYPLAGGVGLVALIVLLGVGLGLAFRGVRRAAPG